MSALDDYLKKVTPPQRAALEKIRKAVLAAAPGATDGVSYGMPAFFVNGIAIAGVIAAAKHCSYFPMSGRVVAALKNDLKGYDLSKGTIRFPAEKPLPAALVRKLVKARLAEIEVMEKEKDGDVGEYLRTFNHPLKKDIEIVRRIILKISPSIREGIKWNAPSFRTTEYFATVNIRNRASVQLVFHFGAKVKDNSKLNLKIPDPNGLIRWLAKDRGLVTIGAGKEIAKNRKSFIAIVKAWIRHV